MKIKKSGAVNISVRQRDIDLREFLDAIPDQYGSDVIRELIRDGIEYQKYARKGIVPDNRFSAFYKLNYSMLNNSMERFFETIPQTQVERVVTHTPSPVIAEDLGNQSLEEGHPLSLIRGKEHNSEDVISQEELDRIEAEKLLDEADF